MAETKVTPLEIYNPVKFSVYRNAALTSSNTATAVAFDTKVYDTGSNVDVVTNKGRFTAPVDGFYHFSGTVGNSAATSTNIYTVLYKNTTAQKNGSVHNSTTAPTYSHFDGTIQMSAGDYAELRFVGGNGSTIGVGADNCWFEGFLVSAT